MFGSIGFDAAVANVPADLRGRQPEGLPYSLWQIVEHLRITRRHPRLLPQLEYEEMKWPDDYWPRSPEPPSSSAWDDSIELYRRDRRELQELATNTSIDLDAQIPHGSGQTYLQRAAARSRPQRRTTSGQLVLVRRLLGVWENTPSVTCRGRQRASLLMRPAAERLEEARPADLGYTTTSITRSCESDAILVLCSHDRLCRRAMERRLFHRRTGRPSSSSPAGLGADHQASIWQ